MAQRLAPVTIKPVGLQVRLAGLRVTNDEIIPLFLSFVKGLNAPPGSCRGTRGGSRTGVSCRFGVTMSTDTTIVLDYGAGNLKSVENALRHLGARFRTTNDPAELADAGAVIFPGVGEAAASMAELTRTGLGEALRAFVASGRKMLGICIGCQVIFDRSEERDTQCLGLFPGVVRRFRRAPA